MAVRFSRSSSEYWSIASTFANGTDFTMMAWVYPVSYHASNWSAIFSLNCGGYACEFAFDNGSGSRRLALWNGSTDSTSSATYAVAAWYHVTLMRTGSNASVYLNGSSVVTQNGQWGGLTGNVYIGEWASGGDYFDGRMAALKIWTGNLTQAKIQQEMHSNQPRNYTNLWAWIPTVATGAGSRNIDYSGNARTPTETNTPTDEDNPPIAWTNSPRYVVLVPSAGGGGSTYYQTIDNLITLVNPLAKQVNIVRSATNTLTTTLTKVFPPLTINSNLSTLLAIAKTAKTTQSHVVTSAETESKSVGKVTTNAVTVTETRQRVISKTLTNLVTSAVAFGKTVVKTVSSIVTGVTTLVKNAAIIRTDIVGALTDTQKTVAKTLNAVSTAINVNTKQISKTLTQSVTGVTTLAYDKFLGITLNMLVTTVDSSTKVIQVVKNQAVSVVDAFSKIVYKTFSNSIASLATLSTQIITGVQLLTLDMRVTATAVQNKLAAKFVSIPTIITETNTKVISITKAAQVLVTMPITKSASKTLSHLVTNTTDFWVQRLGGIDPATIVGSGGIYYYNENVWNDTNLTTGCIVGDGLGGWSPVAGSLPTFLQATAAKKPTRTVSGIYFDGTSDAMSFAGNTTLNTKAHTVMLIGKHPTSSTTKPLISAGSANWYVGVAGGSSLNGRFISSYLDASNTQRTVNTAPADMFNDTEHLYVWQQDISGDNVTITHWRDADQANTVTNSGGVQTSTYSTWYLGGFTTTALYGNWTIKALAIFPFALTDAQRLGILTYWALKYGTPNFITLVLTHLSVAQVQINKAILKQLSFLTTIQTALETALNVTVVRAMRFHAATVSIAKKTIKAVSMAISRRLKKF